MVLDVVLLEHHRKGNADREVGQDCENAVRADAPERQVVRDLVHREESVLVGRAADHVGEDPELPRPERRFAEVVGGRELDERDEQHHPFRERFVAHQFGHLWAYRWRVSNYRQCAATIQAVGRAIKRQNLCTHLGVRLEDRLSPRPMRFLCQRPQKIRPV